MKRDELKPGMVFKENDDRFNRWVRIKSVSPRIDFEVSDAGPNGPWIRTSFSYKPDRFHHQNRSSGYTLCPSLDCEEKK